MKIGIIGAQGRMGRMVQHELGADLSCAAGRDDDKAAVFAQSDVVIDFSVASAAADHAALAVARKTPLVVGTTGLDAAAHAALVRAAEKTSLLYAANMSRGVTVILSLVEQAARLLGDDFDIEIFEAHHRHKVDAPSGTALSLGRAAAAGRGVDFDSHAALDRHGARKTGDIGFAVSRGGDVTGEHAVAFLGTGERVDIVHKAQDRAIFARGAIYAARWLAAQPAGRLYGMRDALGL